MKPPRGKKRIPNGYTTYPIVSNQNLHFLGSLCDDLSVSIASPGDMKILYEMGFYGKGSHSRNEPLFHDFAHFEEEATDHLASVGMDRYVMKQGESSLRVTDKERTVRVDPSQFLHNVSQGIEGSSVGDDGNDLATSPDKNADDSLLSRPSVLTSTLYGPARVEDIHSATSEQTCAESITPAFQPEAEVDPWENEDAEFWSSDRIPETPVLPENSAADNRATVQPGRVDDMETVTPPALEENPAFIYHHPEAFQAQSFEQSVHNEGEDFSESSSDDELILDKLRLRDRLKDRDKSRPGHVDNKYSAISETLILTTCEALFLMLSFNCLVVPCKKDDDEIQETELDADTLWQMAVERDSNFIVQYAVYHHIRAKGWVAKDGLTFGCDFMVYKAGPRYYHSSIGVLARAANADTLREIPLLNRRTLCWTSIMGLNRVLKNVRKELMIIYALLPDHQYEDQTIYKTLLQRHKTVTECLKNIQICEVLCSRVVPSRERE